MAVIRALAFAHAIVKWLLTDRGAIHRPAESTAGSAWTGPWPPGSLPVCVSYGYGEPIFVGYVVASTDQGPRRVELSEFWRAHASAIERHSVGGA